ncbi:MAG: Nif3-like dinuclear metal center hexameric protein [Natronospirillum sp.]|uniref:Nif3-like dinuclear metal center hexameric protein n=1 Tax=Natronospirillum sp. TaxID=2812955 RepID=UPI0025F5C7F6|nr:Nif3-like dinuclear metal center hexameric protein [Natronospirillum sp.]MCH8552262.1 Nif3-like dinuclear metal center hexameric protein [Natronospirillum sp.]
MAVAIRELDIHLNNLLEPSAFQDYCPNGLQVEGRRPVRKLVTGVTASQTFLDAAIANNADAVLVHHGYFWKGEDPCITGMKQRRIATLLEAGVSLWAYHLPLDAHPVLGNNAQLARRLGWKVTGSLRNEARPIGNRGTTAAPQDAESLRVQLEQLLDFTPIHVPGGPETISHVAWCTGAAQGMIHEAAALGADAFVTGEISEPTAHAALELGIHFFAAGHHATERYGVQAVGEKLVADLGLEHQFIDCPIPV